MKQTFPPAKRSPRPFVLAHFAISADGRISTRKMTPAQFTSAADKRRLLEARAESDAVMVGRGTVATDTMSLGLSASDLCSERIARGLPPVPLRVLVSNAGKLDPGWKVFRYAESPLVVFSTARMPASLRAGIARHAELYLFDAPSVDLDVALRILREDFGVRRLVCEGGGMLLRSMLERDLVDGLRLTIAPLVFGGRGAPTLTGVPGGFLSQVREFRVIRQSVVQGEWVVEFRRKDRKPVV